MRHRCKVCGNETIFFTWTTSRIFPREKLIDFLGIRDGTVIKDMEKNGWPVCFNCRNKLD